MSPLGKRQPIVAGNWKMNGTLSQAARIAQEVLRSLPQRIEVEVVLCPPFTALSKVSEYIQGSAVRLGAQNLHWEKQGAYTGEISSAMLKEIGCTTCIIGHSERRQIFQETDVMIQKKVRSAVEQGLRVILCVGETLDQRQSGRTWSVIEHQLFLGLDGLPTVSISEKLVLAYEPVWAIGTGQNATGNQAQEVHAKIRKWLAGRFGAQAAQWIRIQYGGSVKPDNALGLLGQPDVDGALVGGASLDPKAFLSIVESAAQAGKESKCSTG